MACRSRNIHSLGSTIGVKGNGTERTCLHRKVIDSLMSGQCTKVACCNGLCGTTIVSLRTECKGIRTFQRCGDCRSTAYQTISKFVGRGYLCLITTQILMFRQITNIIGKRRKQCRLVQQVIVTTRSSNSSKGRLTRNISPCNTIGNTTSTTLRFQYSILPIDSRTINRKSIIDTFNIKTACSCIHRNTTLCYKWIGGIEVLRSIRIGLFSPHISELCLLVANVKNGSTQSSFFRIYIKRKEQCCRVCVNLTIVIPPKLTLCKITRTIHTNQTAWNVAWCCYATLNHPLCAIPSVIVDKVKHITAPPCSY